MKGPKDVLVLERTNIPVNDICNALCERKNFSQIQQSYPVSLEEIIECIDMFATHCGPLERDFISFDCSQDESNPRNIMVDIDSISEWVFLSIIDEGIQDQGINDDVGKLIAAGITSLLKDAVSDTLNLADPRHRGPLHNLVIPSFEEAFQKITIDNVDEIIAYLNFDLEEIRDRL